MYKSSQHGMYAIINDFVFECGSTPTNPKRNGKRVLDDYNYSIFRNSKYGSLKPTVPSCAMHLDVQTIIKINKILKSYHQS